MPTLDHDEFRISVVIPAFNAGDYLLAALDSVRAQAFPCHEVIVIDDGSDRPVAETVLDDYPGLRIVRQERAGPSSARNLGIGLSRGNFIAFLDADDLWHEQTLERLAGGFARAPAADIVQGHIKRLVTRDGTTSTGPAYVSFNVGSLLARASLFEKAGQFDEALRQSEDVDWHMRTREAGARRLVIPDTVLYYRRHDDAFNERNRPRVLGRDHYGSWMRLLSASLERRRSLAHPATARTADTSEPATCITAVMVVRNGRGFLPRALASIRKQTRPVQRILAIVAESQDGSRDYLASQQDVEVIDQTGTGLARARNQAIEQVRDGLIAFLDCDDVWHESKLALQLHALALFDQPAMCITSYRRQIENPDTAAAPDRDAIGYRLGVTPSTLLAERTLFDEVGGFDPDLGSGCDTDWFARALRMNAACAVVGQTLVTKTVHAGNLSRDPASNRADMFRLIAKHRSRRE